MNTATGGTVRQVREQESARAAAIRYAEPYHLARLGLSGRALLGVEPETIDESLWAASRLADSYLANRYSVPLLSWSTDLTLNTAKLAAWTVLSARGYDPSNPHDVILRTEWEDAIAWLKDVASGEAHLVPPIEESPIPPDGGGGGAAGMTTTQIIVF